MFNHALIAEPGDQSMKRNDSPHRSFETSWGVNFKDGSACFRLWDAGGADVRLLVDGREVPMTKAADGWVEATPFEPPKVLRAS